MKTFPFNLRGLVCGIITFLVFAVAGDAAGRERLVLGLPKLIDMAIEKSPEIAGTQSEIAGAKSELAQADAAYYPQLDTTFFAGPVENTKRPAIAGTRIIDPSQGTSIGAFGRADMTLTQPIYTFGKISNRREAAARGVAVREARLLQKRSEIVLRVKELYYGLVLSRAGVEAMRDTAGYFDDVRSRIDRLLKLGAQNVMESDLYRIDIYSANTVRSQAAAEEGMKTVYFALKSMIRLPADVDFDPADKMLTAAGRRLAGLQDYIDKALAGRPEFKQLEQAILAQKASVEGAISDRYPSFFAALVGSVAGAPGREKFDNPYITDTFNHVNGGIVGGMKWHFDFGILKARVEKERADYDKLLHTKATAELGIPIEVARRYHEVREWQAAVNAYKQVVASSRKWIVAALADFDMGVGTADDLLRSIERYGQNQEKYLEALFNYNMSLARLEHATGDEER
ncbi:MAG TPA: TolC family protein [Syntrophorhabdaceae bacterium]|nr:TolC family protein [Syntrophorhabdaceae bacterium]HQM80356.1 TolC family protein [Syntrophorhabdaceae bacterium]